MRHKFWIFLCLSIQLAVGELVAQDVQVPDDYSIDIQLGIAARSRMMGSNPEIVGTTANAIGESVFHNLIGLSYAQPYPWKLTLVNNESVNAGSTAGGQVYVYGGILPIIGEKKGLWAAVLSHEVAHTGERHVVKLYVREMYIQSTVQYYRARIAAGDNSANYALAAFQISSALLLKKMERDQEHEADQKGMLMMARAGYHPDFVFALHHLLAMDTGEQSKFAAFFSDHPRWQTRDQRSDRVYSDALAEFNRLWPDAANSPGGNPPIVVFLGKPESAENNETRSTKLTVPMYCRNSNAPLNVSVRLYKDKQNVKTTDVSFADKNGDFLAQQQSECFDKADALPLSMELPSSSVPDHDHSVKAEVYVSSGDQILARTQMFDVHFPKRKK